LDLLDLNTLHENAGLIRHSLVFKSIQYLFKKRENIVNRPVINLAMIDLAVRANPHPLTPSPIKGEGEPDWKSLSHFGRGI
jgi:hypothetical protein